MPSISDNITDKHLLVTGGAGFIGSNFCHYWLQKYPHATLIALDVLTYAGNKRNLEELDNYKQFRFVHGSINDSILIEQLLLDYNLDVIVNFAAESHVDRSINNPDTFIQTNIVGTHNLLRSAKHVWLDGPSGRIPHRFHHISTDEVYGTLDPNDLAFREDTPYAPNSPYAASKAASDHLVRAYQHTYGLSTTTSNCSNNYGPYHFPEKLIPLTITNILNNKSLPIYGSGYQIRDWLYVEDHCRGISVILEEGLEGESYNIGGCNEWTNIDVVLLICKIVDEIFTEDSRWLEVYPQSAPALGNESASLIQHIDDRLGHDFRYAIDATKITQNLGFKPTINFFTGIHKTIKWYLEHPEWWQYYKENVDE